MFDLLVNYSYKDSLGDHAYKPVLPFKQPWLITGWVFSGYFTYIDRGVSHGNYREGQAY
jgi:hypothetical protein